MEKRFVSGEVGVLGEENAQRLCSAFSELAFECLGSLAQLSERKGVSFSQLYIAGLKCIPSWSPDVLKEEVANLQTRYPEAQLLYQYCFLSLLADLGENTRQETLQELIGSMPPLSKFYHTFLIRVCTSPDVMRGRFFLEQPQAHRRVIFLEAFRNALHDVVRIVQPPHHQQSAPCAAPQQTTSPQKPQQAADEMEESVFKTALVEESERATNDERTVEVSPSPCFFAPESEPDSPLK